MSQKLPKKIPKTKSLSNPILDTPSPPRPMDTALITWDQKYWKFFFFQTCQILLQFQKTAKERVEIVISAILRGFNDH